MAEFQIRKDDFLEYRQVETPESASAVSLGADEVLVRIERFAFTANNITYAAAGDQLGYWQFFPPSGPDPDGWGVIPVWGFAQVVASNVDDVPVGERLFGYFPPATFLTMTPVSVTAQRFIEGAAHRAQLPAAYNSYSRVAGEPGYDSAMDDERMLLWPLFITSFCLWDVLQESKFHEAKQIVIVSASSKTSIGLAYALAADDAAPPLVAVTSAAHIELVERLGLYDRVVTYDALADIDADVPTTIVDMSGNANVLARLHRQLDDNMAHCINVGLTHWDETGKVEGLIEQRSEFFFAPSHIGKRMKEWGPQEFTRRTSAFLHDTILQSRDWLTLTKIDGLGGLAAVYPAVCKGRIPADQGLIVEL